MPTTKASVYGDRRTLNDGPGYNRGQQGAFALHPLATPKYARGTPRDAEFRDSLARLYIALPQSGDPSRDKAVRDNYLASLPKDPSTQALAQVLLGSNAPSGAGFVDFFLTQANESFQEITQIDKVLGDDYVAFYYGQTPPMFQYSGVLLNSMQDDHRIGFARAYHHMLRGTALARRNALVRLRYDSVIVSGTMASMSQVLNAENEMAVPFNFTLLVKEYVILNNPQFSRTSVAQYVQLAVDTAVSALQFEGGATDPRVRVVATTPSSIASKTPANTSSWLEGISSAGDEYLALSTPTSNVYGTVNTPAPKPPAALGTKP